MTRIGVLGAVAPGEAVADHEVFDGGPPRRLIAIVRLPEQVFPNTPLRTIAVFVLGWLAPAILAISQGGEAAQSFLSDVGTSSRLALAAPLLVIAFPICARRLGTVALHFLATGVVPDDRREDFLTTLRRASRRLRSLWAEAVVFVLAYGAVALTLATSPEVLKRAAWQISADSGLSLAGWWHALISMPLLLMLLIGWLWRILVWTLFLRTVTTLDLRLVAVHPDQMGGLGFLTQSVRAFMIVGLATGCLFAGRFASVQLAGHASALSQPLLVGGTAALVLLLCVGPLTMFTPLLVETWRRGAVSYGALATRLGLQFERRWRKASIDQPMLSEPDFSAAADLYGVVSNVSSLRFIPVDIRSLMWLLGISLAPFVGAMFLSMPTDEVIKELQGLLF